MKKTLSVLLIVALTAVLAVSCATLSGKETGKVVILNAAVKDVEAGVVFNDVLEYVDAYSMEKFVEKNFKYMPSDDTLAISSKKGDDGWQDVIAYGGDPEESEYYYRAGFKARGLVFQHTTDMPEPEDCYVGEGMKFDYRAYDTGITVIGHEAIVLMQKSVFADFAVSELEWNIETSTKKYGQQTLAEGKAWKITDVNGKSTTITAEQFADAVLVAEENNGAKLVLTDGTEIEAVRYMAAVVADDELEEGVVYRFTIAANAKGVYGKEPTEKVSRGGTAYPTPTTSKLNPELAGAFSIAELLDNAGVEEVETVTVGNEDGDELEVEWDAIRTRSLVFHKSKGIMMSGGDLLKNVGDRITGISYIVAGDTILTFVSQEDGYYVSDIFDEFELESTSVKLTYLNGDSCVVPYDLVKDVWFESDSELVSVTLY